MRDLLDLLNSVELPLVEGVGLANRKPGEKFKNSVGDIVTFQDLELYPESGRFATPEELKAGVDSMLANKQLTADQIHWVNNPNKSVGAFSIASFTGEDDTPYYLGRWAGANSPNRTQNKFAHNEIPGGFQYQSRAGLKENTGYKPSEILEPGKFQNNTPETILQQITAKFGEGSDEAVAAQTFISSDIPCKIPKGNMNPDAFRDYFCEMLQPIALVMGKNVTGNADEAADIFFGDSGYADCTISFNTNTIGGLYDSLLVNPDGRQIKLSSKGKDGASASVTNLLKSVEELTDKPSGKKLLNKHKEAVEILNIINKDGHFGAPLTLAVKYGIITPEEAAQISKLKSMGPKDDIVGKGILSPNLEKFYTNRKSKDPKRVIPLEHMTASIAFNVADYVNKKTNFGQAASEILNNAALVQIYTNTSVSTDTITITKMEAVYPSQTVTGVYLDASKVYFSTGGKGNFVFTIMKNGATEKDVNPMDSVDDLESRPKQSATSAGDLDTETNRTRLTGPGAKAARRTHEPRMDRATLGRNVR
jgi:hypothetical protein